MLVHNLTVPGPHSTPPLVLELQTRSLVIYGTADTIVVTNGETLSVLRILAFWEAFSSSLNTENVVRCIAINQERKMVVGSIGRLVAVWVMIDENGMKWKVHSTLVVESDVMALDYHADRIVVGTCNMIIVFALKSNDDLPTWAKEWQARIPSPICITISLTGSQIACSSQGDSSIRIYSIRSRRQMQRIRHPQAPVALVWRPPSRSPSNRDELILLTLTPDGTVRIYMPVLDAPDILQLHATLDRYSFLPDRLSPQTGSPVFWLNRQVIRSGLEASILQDEAREDEEIVGRKLRLKQVVEGEWDLFGRILSDGSFVVRAVANIDSRPPTLLRQFTVLHTPAGSFPFSLDTPPRHLLALASPTPSQSPSVILITAQPLRSYRVFPPAFFDGHVKGLDELQQQCVAVLSRVRNGCVKLPEERQIREFVRTAGGKVVGVVRDGGSLETWARTRSGDLKCLGVVDEIGLGPNVCCLFNEGRTIATYSQATQTLTVYHFTADLGSSRTYEKQSMRLQHPQLPQLFSLPPLNGDTPLVLATPRTLHLILVTAPMVSHQGSGHKITMKLQPTNPLLQQSIPILILPVDPMVWTTSTDPHLSHNDALSENDKDRDAFVTLSTTGELAFWVLSSNGSEIKSRPRLPGWKCTGIVHTGRTEIVMARCSSDKKTVIVIQDGSKQEVTIWDSKESEFSSGLEYQHMFSEDVCDLDWTSTSDSQSILALGFAHKVLMLCPQRMSYFDEAPTWTVLHTIDVSQITPFPISDSIWLSGCSLLIGVGHQMLLYGEPKPATLPSGLSAPQVGGLFEQVAHQNGPLPDFHPQLMLQCLLANKISLVKEIICLLSSNLDQASKGLDVPMKMIPLEKFWQNEEYSHTSMIQAHNRRFAFTTQAQEGSDDEEDSGFNRALVSHVVDALERSPPPHLTASEIEHLIVLIQTTLEIDEQQRSLDANGLRYLISMRSFFIINKRVAEKSVAVGSSSKKGILASFVRERIRYRDIVWAFHSESQEILISASTAACGGKMMWLDARALGVFLWGTSNTMLRDQMETIARNQYMAGEARDPTACCLFYFALGKVKLVHGLWKQAAWHREQSLMLKFLSNDFSLDRWKTAALKNAFALLGKKRFEYAAAFFLLGGSLKDAVNVCLKQLQDFQLAVAIARVTEGGDEGPVFQNILRTHVVPRAFREGNRWLGSWAFWMMSRRDLAVRILLTPLRILAQSLDIPIIEIGDPHFDDPSLALLFLQLKSKSLQTVKGTSEISGRTEFNFVLQMARVLCRMGCHVLALDLVRSWSFDRPAIPQAQMQATDITEPLDMRLQELQIDQDGFPPSRDRSVSRSRGPPSPRMRKSFQFMRRTSLVIDMEIPSLPPTEPSSPPLLVVSDEAPQDLHEEPNRGRGQLATTADAMVRQVGFGSLMKNARKDVAVPEFDMGAFF